MKTSNILIILMTVVLLIGMLISNSILKKEFSKIDLTDKHKNYISYDLPSYSVLKVEGSNGYPIDLLEGSQEGIKVLRSREKHFKYRSYNDTLFVEFSGSNIPMQRTLANDIPSGIIIEKRDLDKVIFDGTQNRIAGFNRKNLEINLDNKSILDISAFNLRTLNIIAENESQFIFSNDNEIDTLNIRMTKKSVGRLEKIKFVEINQILSDDALMVLSKNSFDILNKKSNGKH